MGNQWSTQRRYAPVTQLAPRSDAGLLDHRGHGGHRGESGSGSLPIPNLAARNHGVAALVQIGQHAGLESTSQQIQHQHGSDLPGAGLE